ncbi:MAG: class I SAM-dependent methyltransferase [Anaerolineae bacterium]|nr:class I SAM-dependent methyltransferase [Anaerolineae bacterium]
MPNYTTVIQKYAQPDVVNFWKALSQTGLQQCEREMVARYFPRQGRLLDIGCGTGRAVLALSQVGYDVTGIDVSQAMLAAGRSLSHEAQLAGANLLNLPFVDESFDGVFMFFGALQHIPGCDNRRRALAEMARVTRPHGRLILGLDNVAPGLTCYRYWLNQKLRSSASKPASTHNHIPLSTTDADSTLWDRQTRQMHPLVWHARGLARTLRWRTWPGLRDDLRRLSPFNTSVEPGDVWVAQFAIPTTPGRIYYHLYQVDELIADAATSWRLLDHHSGSELNEQQVYPAAIRGQDKQLFFAFERE